MNKDSLSNINIRSLEAITAQSKLKINGNIRDFLNSMLFDVQIKGKLHLPDLKALLPSDMNIKLNGTSDVNTLAKFTLNDLQTSLLKMENKRKFSICKPKRNLQ